MVRPVPPNITEPLSVCSRRVRLDQMLRGAEVALRGRAGREIGRWTATWPDELFDFDSDVSLLPGELVWANQELAGEASSWSTVPVAVQEAMSSTPLFDLPVMACSTQVSASAVAPGSTVTVIDTATGAALGSASGGVRVSIPVRPIVVSDRLQLRATPCGGQPGVVSAVPPVDELRTVATGDRRLLPVELELPLRACQRLITVHHGQPGTTFVLAREDGTRASWALHSAGPAILRVDELRENENLVWGVTQSQGSCDVLDSDSTGTTVLTDKPPKPTIVTMPCPGSPAIELAGLVASATVRLRVDGLDVRECVASGSGATLDVGDVGLAPGQRLTAVQRLCNDWSDPSLEVEVVAASTDLKPRIVEPLEACARTIVVTDVSPGALVVVLDLGAVEGELARAIANESTVAIDVPPLQDRHTIAVKVLGCHPFDLKALVQTAPPLAEPTLLQAWVGTRTVVVGEVVAGTTVDVYVNGHYAKGRTASGATVDVTLDETLLDGDMVELLARRCQYQTVVAARPATAAPVPAYALLQSGGIDCGGGNWASGKVECVVGVPGDVLVLGCSNSGVWISHADGSAESVGLSWPSANVNALAVNPTNPVHVFAATGAGLRETDPLSADPLHTWRDVPLPAPMTGTRLTAVVITDARLVVVAGDNGVAWAPIPFPGAPWTFSTDPTWARPWTGAVAAPGGVVLAGGSSQPVLPLPGKPGNPLVPGVLLRGDWQPATSSFSWADHAGTAPAAFTARMDRTVMASCPGDPKHLYALSADAVFVPKFQFLLGVLHSDDGGRTWACHHFAADQNLKQFAFGASWDMGVQAAENLAIAVHPTAPNRVLVVARNQRLLSSTDFTATFDPGPRITDPSFHEDNRGLTWDLSTGTLRVLVGGDGGIYVSRDDDGRSFDSSRNRGPSNLLVDGAWRRSMASAPAVPGSCSIGLQDNGEASTVPGDHWRQSVRGDGLRQVVVLGEFLLHCDNDDPPLQWSLVSAAGIGPNREVVRPPPDPDGGQPTFQDFLAPVEEPSWRGPDGRLLVAYAAELVGPAQQPRLYGIFDDPSAGDARFAGSLLAVLPGVPKGLASFDGRTAVLCTQDTKPHLYRFDAASGTLLESAIPKPTATSELWSPVMSGPRSGAVIYEFTVLVSQDLQTWGPLTGAAGMPAPKLPYPITVISFDRGAHPPALHVATASTVAVVRENGALVSPAAGLPAHPQSCQLSVVADANGDRWVYLGTYGWSVWRARLN